MPPCFFAKFFSRTRKVEAALRVTRSQGGRLRRFAVLLSKTNPIAWMEGKLHSLVDDALHHRVGARPFAIACESHHTQHVGTGSGRHERPDKGEHGHKIDTKPPKPFQIS